MIGRFEARGMSRQDAELVVSKIAQYENFFVGLMVSEELGLQLSEDDDAMLITDAFVMFIAFASVGLIPVLTLLIGAIDTFSDEFVSSIAVVTSLVLVLFLGILKSHYSSTSWVYSALEALLSGGVCFGASFIVGKTLMSAAEAI